jgi:hypothetical protein
MKGRDQALKDKLKEPDPGERDLDFPELASGVEEV